MLRGWPSIRARKRAGRPVSARARGILGASVDAALNSAWAQFSERRAGARGRGDGSTSRSGVNDWRKSSRVWCGNLVNLTLQPSHNVLDLSGFREGPADGVCARSDDALERLLLFEDIQVVGDACRRRPGILERIQIGPAAGAAQEVPVFEPLAERHQVEAGAACARAVCPQHRLNLAENLLVVDLTKGMPGNPRLGAGVERVARLQQQAS